MVAAEDATMEAMAKRWARAVEEIEADLDALYRDMLARQEAGNILSRAALTRVDRYKYALAQAEMRYKTFAEWSAQTIEARREQYAELGVANGIDDIKNVWQTGIGSELPNGFGLIDTAAIDNLIGGAMARQSPLNALLRDKFRDYWETAVDELTKGMSLGRSPRKVADDIAVKLAKPLDDMLRITRTETVRAYRDATQDTYKESGVVQSYRRLATKDTRTCMACIALDGKRYRVGEPLVDHPNGRCAMVPTVDGAPDVSWQPGQDWFKGLDPEDQRKMLGPGRFTAWQAGEFDLDALAKVRTNDTWGDSVGVTPLKELK